MTGILAKCKAAAVGVLIKVPVVQRMVQRRGKVLGQSQAFRDLFSREMPSAETPFHIFKDSWSSAVPGFATGASPLFDDDRIHWLEEQLGSFAGKRVLELGPLEGGHTSMMERAGATVVAIEANQRGFLKCLIVKHALKLQAEFLYGDFRPYVATARPSEFDFVLAVGVLYHMLEPVQLLHDIARITDSFGLWTHYYDPAVIGSTARFNPQPVMQTVDGVAVEVYEQHYLSSISTAKFIGGSEPTSHWLTRNGLIGYIEKLGFAVQVGDETLHHPHGPCILLFAKRR